MALGMCEHLFCEVVDEAVLGQCALLPLFVPCVLLGARQRAVVSCRAACSRQSRAPGSPWAALGAERGCKCGYGSQSDRIQLRSFRKQLSVSA